MAGWIRTARIFSRGYASSIPGAHGSTEEAQRLWKRLTLFVGLPAILVAMVNCYLNHKEHAHDERPEFIAYEHMRIRTKPFPWGDGNHTLFHNPRVNALPTGAVAVFCVGKIRFNWSLLGDMTLSAFALLAGAILLVSSYIYNIWLLYAGYIIFGVIYHTSISVTCVEIAKYISEDSYGLVFGINMFLALVMQTLLSLVVLNIFMLHIRWQFYFYGCYFIVVAVMYVVMGVINLVQHYRSGEDFHIWVRNDDNVSPGMTQNANGIINTAESLESKNIDV